MTEDDHVRDTYAYYGLAMYAAQVLEHGLVNAMVAARLPERRTITRGEIDNFMDRQFEKTLGQLLRELERYVTVPADLSARLSEALSKRNWLAHDCFRERATTFITQAGRDSMIREFQAVQHLFECADHQLSELVRPIREKHGVTNEAIAAEYDALQQNAGLDG